MESSYLGIVIEQSLRDPRFLSAVEVVHRERDPHGDWVFVVVRVQRDGASAVFGRLQRALDSGKWYAHFFAGDDLVVVYPDAVFAVKTDPATWSPAVTHGIGLGIPEAQLDFEPHTRNGVEQRFGNALGGRSD